MSTARARGSISPPMVSSISTTVTRFPRAARKSAVSSPTSPPPMTRAESVVTSARPSRRSWADTQLDSSRPGKWMISGTPPVATTATSGAISRTISGVTGVFRWISTPARRTIVSR